MVVQIADGNDTRVWEDHWLHVLPPGKLQSPCLLPNMKVSEFIDQETRTWNVTRIRDYVAPEEVDLITCMRLSRYSQCDKYVWPYTADMNYTVKSGYWAATHLFSEGEPIQQPPGSLSIKREIWKLEILPKIHQFLWKVVSGALPTYVQLCIRGINTDPVCQRCCMEEESINHVMFLCPHALAIWHCFCSRYSVTGSET